MIKAGLSSFWGLSLVSDVTPTFWVMLACILFLISVIAVATALFEHKMIGSVTAVMATLGLFLWHKGASYGLFKASLYIQPFLAALIAEYLTRLFLFCRRWVTDRAPSRIVGLPHFAAVAGSVGLCLLLGITFIGQTITLLRYGKIATDDPDTALFNEIPGSSREGLLNQLATLARLNGNGHYVVDSYNPALTKLIVYYTRGTPTLSVSQNPFKMSDFGDYMTKLDPDWAPEFAMLNPVEFSFAWSSLQENDAIRLQAHGRERAYSNDVLIATGSDNSILNRFGSGHPLREALTLRDFAHVSNHVGILPSNKSRPYFDYDFKIDQEEEVREYRRHVALYPNEPDDFYHGRHLLCGWLRHYAQRNEPKQGAPCACGDDIEPFSNDAISHFHQCRKKRIQQWRLGLSAAAARDCTLDQSHPSCSISSRFSASTWELTADRT